MKRHMLGALGFALVTAIALPACYVSGSGTMSASTTPVVYTEPPPEQVETVTVRPGFVWVKGRWDWRNGQWAWIDGHWEGQRAKATWIAGRWELQGNYYVWIEGRWDTQGARGPGPEVRDHR